MPFIAIKFVKGLNDIGGKLTLLYYWTLQIWLYLEFWYQKTAHQRKPYWKATLFFFPVFTLLSSVRGQCSEAGITLNGTTGSFASPNYPSNYPNRETCRWIIEVPQEHVVHLSFDVFVMEKCAIPSPTCSCDHVEIRDGPNVNSPKLAKYCGDENPGAIMSSGRFMWVEFDSDFFSNAQGFLATYIAVGMWDSSFSLIQTVA